MSSWQADPEIPGELPEMPDSQKPKKWERKKERKKKIWLQSCVEWLTVPVSPLDPRPLSWPGSAVRQPQAKGASECWILFVGRAYPISKLHNNLERFLLSGAAEVGAENSHAAWGSGPTLAHSGQSLLDVSGGNKASTCCTCEVVTKATAIKTNLFSQARGWWLF